MAIAATQIEDRPGRAIALVLLAWLCFSFTDASVKWLVTLGLPVTQLAFMRYASHFVVSTASILRGGLSPSRFATTHVWTVLFRAFLLVSATFLNFYALQFLPLTVTSAIIHASPIFVCLLSWPLLGERVGIWRWFAIVLGFSGVLIVIRPFGEAIHWTALLMVYNALALALYSILTRKLAGIVATETMQFYMGAVGTLALLPLAVIAWESPKTSLDWFLMTMLGIWAWAGHSLLIRAHTYAAANVVMPFSYSFLFYLAIIGYLVFGDIPDFWTIIGAFVIIISGMIIWWRRGLG